MSTRYKRSADVPNAVLAERLKELASIIATGNLGNEFTMRVPAELDRDADLVLAEAANRIMLIDAASHTFGRESNEWITTHLDTTNRKASTTT